MTPAELHPAIREALGAHEGFRRLGFYPAQIFIKPAAGQLFITVKRDGLEFNACMGSCDLHIDELRSQWGAAVQWWNGPATEEQRDEIFRAALTTKDSVGVIFALMSKGFDVHRGRDA